MKDQFKKYLWILDLLYSSGGITFKEMAEKWKESSLNDRKTILAKRTFDDYRRAIEETFDVDIICDASRGYQYRIDNARSLSTDRIKRWLLSSFAVNNVLQGSRRLSERIIYEDIPSGNDYLLEVVKAMQDGKVISVEYDNFFESTPKTTADRALLREGVPPTVVCCGQGKGREGYLALGTRQISLFGNNRQEIPVAKGLLGRYLFQ